MTFNLVDTLTDQILYDRRTGRFRDSTGQFVPKSRVVLEVDREIQRTETRLRSQARLLATNRIDLSSFQKQVAETLKRSHLRQAMMAAGGRDNTTAQQFGIVGYNLRQQYQRLTVLGQDLAAGKVSLAQLNARLNLYARSSATSFYSVQKQARSTEGFIEAKRSLDLQANHCPECVKYSTNGQFRPIAEVMPVATNCSCRGNCRCIISYRKPTGFTN